MTLIQGADTDTNSKICGNLMGAFHGIETITCDPVIKRAIKKVMAFDCVNYNAKHSEIGINRPKSCNPSNIYRLINNLIV